MYEIRPYEFIKYEDMPATFDNVINFYKIKYMNEGQADSRHGKCFKDEDTYVMHHLRYYHKCMTIKKKFKRGPGRPPKYVPFIAKRFDVDRVDKFRFVNPNALTLFKLQWAP